MAAILLAGNTNREILLIIKNYTGDRLNFGLAVEMASNLHGFQHIKMLVVDDDCSIDNVPESIGRRGLAGVCFIHKIAGAMSAKGYTADEIFNLCQSILQRREIRTIGFVCSHDLTSNKLSNIEIGYGIHGEPGSINLDSETNFNRILAIMDDKMLLKAMKGKDVAILINNLGGMSEFIFNQFTFEFFAYINDMGINVRKIYAGKYLTSLKKEGLSVSLMELNDARLMEFLEMPVKTPFGYLFDDTYVSSLSRMRDGTINETSIPQTLTEQMRSLSHCKHHQQHEHQRREDVSESRNVWMIRNAILKSIVTVIEIKDHLNRIDAELGDGDTGSTFAQAATLLERELNSGNMILSNPKQMLAHISEIFMDGVGGTSGAIFSIFFQCTSKAFDTKHDSHSVENWKRAIAFGIEGIMKHGKSKVGDRTVLDALNTGLNAINSTESQGLSASDFLKLFADGCALGAERTKTMRPRVGRSCYSVSDQSEDFQFKSVLPDPGAYIVGIITQALADSISNSMMKYQ